MPSCEARSLLRLRRGCIVLLACFILRGTPQRSPALVPAEPLAEPLALDPFEDDDCLEVRGAEVLAQLMDEMAELLEAVLYAGEPDDRELAWGDFRGWARTHATGMANLAAGVLGRPYCEPGKLAWMAAQCLLLLDGSAEGSQDALDCAAALDEDLLKQMTPPGQSYATRLHLVLRSPWPALRLLDLLVRLHPENGSTRMGACRAFRNWQSDTDAFDWPWFKALVTDTVDKAVHDTSLFELRPEDGPLSSRYRARWLRVYAYPGMKEAIAFSDDVFEAYREHHYRAGCHIGVISAYILQLLPLHLRDTEGRLQRVAASVAQLLNLHAPFSHLIKTDWPLFRLLYLLSLVQRSPPSQVWLPVGAEVAAPKAKAAQSLVSGVEDAVSALTAGQRRAEAAGLVYVTGAEGRLARHAGVVISRWRSLAIQAPLVFLAMDSEASTLCRRAATASGAHIRCVEASSKRGVEGVVAKYLAMASILRQGLVAAWIDLDVYVVRDPTPAIMTAFDASPPPDLIFARDLMSESMVPAVVVARPLQGVVELLMKYAYWLRDNPYLLDHQGWDQILNNKVGDHSVSTDYKGRDVSIKDPNNRPGPNLSFLPNAGQEVPRLRFAALGPEYGSGDGWLGSSDGSGLSLFHFWGAEEGQADLFEMLYPYDAPGFSPQAFSHVARYYRQPVSGPRLPAVLAGGRPLYLVAVSYADGCCKKSLQKNRKQALLVGADEARAYSRADLDPSWLAKNNEVLSQRRGGGWWLWKPKLILQTLKDPAVPWQRGVVSWVDAGNFLHADPRSTIVKALRDSDVSAMRLKLCIESDWTSGVTFQQLNATNRYAWTDRPQIGAYFLLFRKTAASIAFVEEWLRLSEDPKALLGGAATEKKATEIPGFQIHQADQSVLSILFKAYGFRAMTLEEGHQVVTLARWRE